MVNVPKRIRASCVIRSFCAVCALRAASAWATPNAADSIARILSQDTRRRWVVTTSTRQRSRVTGAMNAAAPHRPVPGRMTLEHTNGPMPGERRPPPQTPPASRSKPNFAPSPGQHKKPPNPYFTETSIFPKYFCANLFTVPSACNLAIAAFNWSRNFVSPLRSPNAIPLPRILSSRTG